MFTIRMFEVCQHVSATVAANPSCSEYLFVWVEFDVVVVVAAVAVTVVSVAVVFAYGPKTGPAFLLFLRCDMLGG